MSNQPQPENGPAFARGVDAWGNVNDGMSLRDYFAAKAMQSVIVIDPTGTMDNHEMAEVAYKIADAMLAARGGAS